MGKGEKGERERGKWKGEGYLVRFSSSFPFFPWSLT